MQSLGVTHRVECAPGRRAAPDARGADLQAGGDPAREQVLEGVHALGIGLRHGSGRPRIRGDEAEWTVLYDLAADPGATTPVAEPDRERVDTLKDLLARWIAAGLEVRPAGVGGDAATRSALDAMGYTN